MSESQQAIYARAGEWVTCEGPEHHHRICRVSHVLGYGSVMRPDDMVEWRQKEPQWGQRLPIPCEMCGASWARTRPESVGTQLHFENGGWR